METRRWLPLALFVGGVIAIVVSSFINPPTEAQKAQWAAAAKATAVVEEAEALSAKHKAWRAHTEKVFERYDEQATGYSCGFVCGLQADSGNFLLHVKWEVDDYERDHPDEWKTYKGD